MLFETLLRLLLKETITSLFLALCLFAAALRSEDEKSVSMRDEFYPGSYLREQKSTLHLLFLFSDRRRDIVI